MTGGAQPDAVAIAEPVLAVGGQRRRGRGIYGGDDRSLWSTRARRFCEDSARESGDTYFLLIVGVFFVIFAITLASRIPEAPDSPGRGFAKVWCIAAVFAGLVLIAIALFVGSDDEADQLALARGQVRRLAVCDRRGGRRHPSERGGCASGEEHGPV